MWINPYLLSQVEDCSCTCKLLSFLLPPLLFRQRIRFRRGCAQRHLCRRLDRDAHSVDVCEISAAATVSRIYRALSSAFDREHLTTAILRTGGPL